MIRALKRIITKSKRSNSDVQFINYGNYLQKKVEKLPNNVFVGGPVKDFENVGRLQLITLLKIGLYPQSKVLDVGCGCLRGGYWLIHFLGPMNYCGIEPNNKMLDVGIEHILDPNQIEHKKPRFDKNSDFDFSVFNEKFNFVIARSIWTHASKFQIEKMLDSFVKNSEDDAVFLTSYKKPLHSKQDYYGNSWVGRSHESNQPGIVCHSYSWIKKECKKRNLKVRELDFDVYKQYWLLIRK